MTFSDSWHSYPKVYAIGHMAIKEILLDEVLIEEKIDGSQFSFGRFGDVLKCRSKGVELDLCNPEKMFIPGIEYAKSIFSILKDGWTYRGNLLEIGDGISDNEVEIEIYDSIEKTGLVHTLVLSKTDVKVLSAILTGVLRMDAT